MRCISSLVTLLPPDAALQVLVEGNEVANTPAQSVSGSATYNVSQSAIGVLMRGNK